MESLSHPVTIVVTHAPPLNSSPPTSDALFFPISRSSIHLSRSSYINSSHTNLHSSFLGFHSTAPPTQPFVCFATGPGSPSPESDPPPGKHPVPTTDLEATFYRIQDKVQIFLAVLFWMSLFFWTCAWDGSDDGSGPNKGSRFRR